MFIFIIGIKDCIIITDIGSPNIGDFISLLYLLSQSSINIKGIICTHHYIDDRCKIVNKILKLCKCVLLHCQGHGIHINKNLHKGNELTRFKTDNPGFHLFLDIHLLIKINGIRVLEKPLKKYRTNHLTKSLAM